MNAKPRSRMRQFTTLEVFSPAGLALAALLWALLWALCELVGMREATTFLSGTAVGGDFTGTGRRGILYLLSYFGFVLGTPILLIASALLALWQKYLAARRSAKNIPAASPLQPTDHGT